jgi:hypothetical protein
MRQELWEGDEMSTDREERRDWKCCANPQDKGRKKKKIFSTEVAITLNIVIV